MKPPLHPIILLWVHPRSLSTALERIMRAPKLQEFLERHWPYYLELSSAAGRSALTGVAPSVSGQEHEREREKSE